MKVVYHETFRNISDRVRMAHDKEWVVKTLEEVCKRNFMIVEDMDDKDANPEDADNAGDDDAERKKFKERFLWPIQDPDQFFYSTWNQEVEGFYMEVEEVGEV